MRRCFFVLHTGTGLNQAFRCDYFVYMYVNSAAGVRKVFSCLTGHWGSPLLEEGCDRPVEASAATGF